ncbi:hypothetical protein DPMN_176467 [Dreissena polymorpha]|uniref:Uncharacterized protein n=1 Tax=Dreissena polymorpha TaxID=45954 RepID=A0A9D4IGY1_DREPO|nr:hypothetical protein DPMN_176467 [Dreissena polymorpha]
MRRISISITPAAISGRAGALLGNALYRHTEGVDTLKVFDFRPDSLYDNILEDRSGNPKSKHDICGEDMSNCTLWKKPENVIVRYAKHYLRSFSSCTLSTLPIPLSLSSQQTENVTNRNHLSETFVGILKLLLVSLLLLVWHISFQ